MNEKGFLLTDALISVLTVSLLCVLCFSIYRLIDNYDEGLDEYIEESNEQYDYLFGGIESCERCVVEETKELY